MINIVKCSEYNVRAMKNPDFKEKIPGFNFSYPVMNTIDIPDKHINLVVYSVKNFLPNIETLELFDNLVKAGKVSLHFCKDNLIYNSQTPVSEIARLNMATLAYQYHNIHFVPKDKLQYIADKIHITQMQENIKANILKNQ